MKATKFELVAAFTVMVGMTSSAEAGWRRKVVVVTTPAQTVYVTPAPVVVEPVQQTAWRTSTGDVVYGKHNMIPAEPIGISAPPLPVATSYEVITPRRIKVVTPRQVVYYRTN